MPPSAAPIVVSLAMIVACLATSPAAQPTRPVRAVWLWNPGPALTDAAARAALFEFLEHEGIGRVWAQIHVDPGTDTATAPRLRHEAAWRKLLAEAHGRGLRIEALDGDPTYALRAYHHLTRRVVDALLAFNRAAGPREQFDGLHLDIEPYQLLSWRFRLARETILHEYLDLMVECRRRLYEFPGMQFGADIPSWWGAIDNRTGRPIADVDYGGTRKAASAHLIDRVDSVGIMNYRHTADGPDGMVALGTDVLAYADRARAARIWMGVETSRSAPAPVWFAIGLPVAEADALLQRPDLGIGRDNQFEGYRVRVFDDGVNTHVGLSLPEADRVRPSSAFLAALAKLAARAGVLSTPAGAGRTSSIQAQALRGFRADREWEAPALRPIEDPVTKTAYPGLVATSIMLPKLTFAGMSKTAMRKELALAELTFSTHASYAGIAIHDVEHYRAMADAPPTLARLLPRPQ